MDDDTDIPNSIAFMIILFFGLLAIIAIYTVIGGHTLLEIKDILKSEGGDGNFTDEDLEKIREIIVK